jgi:hypothetical protein
LAVNGFAQADTATIVGTIRDESGAVVSGATITASEVKTGIRTVVKSGSDGNYVVRPESSEGMMLKKWMFRSWISVCGKDTSGAVCIAKAGEMEGLKLKAEIEVKGRTYPVRWACHQKLNEDGTLTLHPDGRHVS